MRAKPYIEKVRITLVFFLILGTCPHWTWASIAIYPQSYVKTHGISSQIHEYQSVFVIGDKANQTQLVDILYDVQQGQNISWVLSDEQWSQRNIFTHVDDRAKRFANFLESHHVRIVPERRCPKPLVVKHQAYDMIVIDTNWYLHQVNDTTLKNRCPYSSMDDYYWQLERTMINAKQKPLLILSYHSPLPNSFIQERSTSVYSTIKGMVGNSTLSNPAYQKFQEKFLEFVKERPNTAVISVIKGQTQLIRQDNFHHVGLGYGTQDWIEIKQSKNKDELHVFVHHKDTDIIRLTSRPKRSLAEKPCKKYQGPMYEYQSVTDFEAWFMGDNYREDWRMELDMPCLDLHREGYKIDRVVGRRGNLAFLIKDQKNNQHALIPLHKKIDLPDILQGTIAEKVYRNYRSAYHPLGFLLANALKKQAGMPYLDMEMVYLDTKQDAFRSFYQGFYSGLYLRVRTSPMQEGQVIADTVHDSFDTIPKVEQTRNHEVDQNAYLQTLLFDLLVGDWERGHDTWQWIERKIGDKTKYVPISFQKKAAFYDGDGSVFWWAKRKWLEFEWQDYDKELVRPESILVRSYSMDHRYTSSLNNADWVKAVLSLQNTLSKTTFEKAVKNLPVHMTPETESSLITWFAHRLDKLPDYAQSVRLQLQQRLDVVGSANQDRFEFYEKDQQYFIRAQDNDGVYFEQVVDKSNTREVRVYGLGGRDQFTILSSPPNGMRVRLMPGGDRDEVSYVGDKKNGYRLYVPRKKEVVHPATLRPKNYMEYYADDHSSIHAQKMSLWEPTTFFASSSPDTSFMFGGGLRYNHPGFQKSPWHSSHEFKFNTLFGRAAFNFNYNSMYYDLLGLSDLRVIVDVGLPRFYGLFFGLGNETTRDVESDNNRYYWLRGYHFFQRAELEIPISEHFQLKPIVQLRVRDFVQEDDSFLQNDDDNDLDAILGPGTNDNIYKPNIYPGGGLRIQYLLEDQISGPVKKRSLRLYAQWLTHVGLEASDGIFHKLSLHGDCVGYVRKSKTQWKLALGYGKNFGDWEFFDAQFLGRNSYLRGFTSDRFGGESKVYTSFEVNQSLVFKNRPIFSDIGLGPYVDQGRVYLENDPGNSDKWHVVLGMQAYTVLLNTIALKAGYGYPINDVETGIWIFELTTEI